MKMLRFDFEIQYKPGWENRAANTLSKNPSFETQLATVTTAQVESFEGLEREVASDSKLQGIVHDLLSDPYSHKGYQPKHDRLLYDGRLVLPKNSSFISKFLKEFHSSPYRGHFNFFRTYKRAAMVLFWEGMKANIRKYVAECDLCQRVKYQALSPVRLLQSLPLPTQIWQDILMAFIMGLPKAGNVDTILVVVDRMTKYSHFLILKHLFSAVDVAQKFIREIVRLHGFPRSIISDRDRIFMSQF